MMFLDISKKPGDPDAVKTADDILADYARNLIKGARCHNPDCRALLKGSDAFRDMIPATKHKETKNNG